jgi:hypothetical protein
MATLDGVLVSRKAARKWNLKEGDVFTVIVGAGVRADGSNSWPFEVLGIVPDDPERSHGYMDKACRRGRSFAPQGLGIPEATVSPSVFAWSLAAACVLALISSALPLLK